MASPLGESDRSLRKLLQSEGCSLPCMRSTLAALPVPHWAALSPDIASPHSAARLHCLKLFFRVSAACYSSLPSLRSPHFSSPHNSWPGILLSFIFCTGAVQWSCIVASVLHTVGLAVFQDFVLVTMSLIVMLTKNQCET